MASFDGTEFLQALLITLFLYSLLVLIPNVLVAVAALLESQSHTAAWWIENLHRHNPWQQWMAERRLLAEVTKNRFRLLDERRGIFLNKARIRKLISPNWKWLLLCLLYVFIYVSANIFGAFTILWEKSVSGERYFPVVKYPAFPVSEGLNEMKVRGNCKWTEVDGSGDLDTFGFVIYQICLDVLPINETGKLAKNEVRAIHRGKYYRLVWSLETLTKGSIDEYWRVSRNNEDRLEKAREPRDYLENCDKECQRKLHGYGEHEAIIHQALKEAGMVERRLIHYENSSREFRVQDELKDRKTRLMPEAWVTMVGVTIVALLWSLVGVVKPNGETDFAILTRIVRNASDHGPCSVASILEQSHEIKPYFGVGKRPFPRTMQKSPEESNLASSSSVSGDDVNTKSRRIRSSDMCDAVEGDCDRSERFIHVAQYSYDPEFKDHAKPGMILVAHRAEPDEEEVYSL